MRCRSCRAVGSTDVDIVSILVRSIELCRVISPSKSVFYLMFIRIFEFTIDQGQLFDIFESLIMWVNIVYLGALVRLSDVIPLFVLVQPQSLRFICSQHKIGRWVPLIDCLISA